MKKQNITILTLIFALLLSTACDQDFEEINTNPNVPLEVPTGLLLPAIIKNTSDQMLGEAWGIGNIVVQHTAKIQFVNEDRYGWGEINGIWNTVYSNMRNVRNMLQLAEQNGQKNYEAVGLIMKSWMFSLVTDTYGDAPYSQATLGKTDEVFFPVYDAQEQIYAGILADLKKANELLGTSAEKLDGDILFNGDIIKWKKFANSLRLRYLMRISDRKDVKADMAAILNDPAGNPIFTSNADNAALSYLAAAPNQFPLHTTRVGSFDEFRLSKTLGDKLIELNDTRLGIFARPTAATENTANPVFAGVPNGLDDVEALTYNGGAQNVSRVGKVYYEDAITSKGLSIAKGVMMSYAELQFILAEAAQKGFISGDAKSFYEKGITASFNFYGLEVPASYLSQPGVAYDAANGLTLIGTQKWISLFFNGLEAWYDWRRTGIPAITPGKANLNDNRVPVRFIYPLSEQALNGENRAAAVARQGADNINTRVWWDVK